MSYGLSVKLLIFVTIPVLIWVSQQPLAIVTLLEALQIQAFVTTLLVLMPPILHAVLRPDIPPLKREMLLPPALALGVVGMTAMILAPAAMAATVGMAEMAAMAVVLASLMIPVLMVSLTLTVQET